MLKIPLKKLAKELPEIANVTAFAFEKRENTIVSKGIENLYDEEILEPFSNLVTEVINGQGSCPFVRQ